MIGLVRFTDRYSLEDVRRRGLFTNPEADREMRPESSCGKSFLDESNGYPHVRGEMRPESSSR